MIKKSLLTVGVLSLLFCGGALAAFKLSGNTSGAFCEIIEVTGGPLYTIAAGGIVNGINYRNAAGTELSFNPSGGTISYTYGENEETPSGGGTIGPKTLMVRCWTGSSKGNGNYSYSQTFALGKSMDGIRPIALSFSPWYAQAAPPAPGVSAVQTGFNMNVKPIVYVTLDLTPLAGYEIVSLNGGKFNYKTKLGATIVEERNSDSSQISLDPNIISAGITYDFNVFARNGFGNGAVGVGQVATVSIPMGEVVSQATLVNGLNFFSLGVPPIANNGGWSCSKDNGATWPDNVKTIDELINVIGGSTNVSTFGIVTSAGAVEGKLYNGTTWIESPNFGGGALSATQGYQVFCKGLPGDSLTLKFRNQ